MCIVFFALGVHPKYPIVIASNRDELYDRPSRCLSKWPFSDEELAGDGRGATVTVIGGRDGDKGGTWLGVTESGAFAVLTNKRARPKRPDPNAGDNKPSRGVLVPRFLLHHHQRGLTSDCVSRSFCEQTLASKVEFEGFNLVCGDLRDPSSFCHVDNHTNMNITMLTTGTAAGGAAAGNREQNGEDGGRAEENGKNDSLRSSRESGEGGGIHAVCNATIDVPWPKVANGRALFEEIVSKHAREGGAGEAADLADRLLRELLQNEDTVGDDELPETGMPLEIERLCAPIFVNGRGYGTMASTVILVSRDGDVLVRETTRPQRVEKVREQNCDGEESEAKNGRTFDLVPVDKSGLREWKIKSRKFHLGFGQCFPRVWGDAERVTKQRKTTELSNKQSDRAAAKGENVGGSGTHLIGCECCTPGLEGRKGKRGPFMGFL